MICIKSRQERHWSALALGLLGLLVGLCFWAISPAHAQELVSSVKIRVAPHEVEVRDVDDNVIGMGQFRAAVTGNRLGRVSGMAELQMADFTLHYDFYRLDEILYEDGQPSGVVLSGRGALTRNGQTETFDGKVTTSAIRNDCLIWDIPGAPVILTFDVPGQLVFR